MGKRKSDLICRSCFAGFVDENFVCEVCKRCIPPPEAIYGDLTADIRKRWSEAEKAKRIGAFYEPVDITAHVPKGSSRRRARASDLNSD